ncbi:MAG: hypothetical protein KME50_37875 [Nostoc desertorum CM1-VF14]|nr:hypothetical protein [Nostoc desertorum CM1-VF14]
MQIYFTAWNACIVRVAVVAGQLRFIKIDTSDTQNKATSAIAPVVNASPIAQPLTQLQEPEIYAEEEIEEEEVNAMPAAVNHVPLDTDQAGELLAVQDKADLVASTAESMGIELQLNEVTNIASNLDYSGDSLNESIGDIRTAITAFVEYKAQINQQKINHMIDEVRATVNQRNQETSGRLNKASPCQTGLIVL